MIEFQFKSYHFDMAVSAATFKYAVDNQYFFEEKITFEQARKFEELPETSQQAFFRALENLFIAVGISYYKAFIPEKIKFEAEVVQLTPDEANFWNTFYTQGLAEFAYQNKLELQGKINFPVTPNLTKTAQTLTLSETVLVPVGGGKDSNVTIEALRAKNIHMLLFAVRSLKVINNCMRVANLPSIIIGRTISPELIRLNNDGVTLNGHVPITGIISFIAVATAILNGLSAVVLSNERSADEANVDLANHQWSKSFEAEQLIATHIKRYIVSNLDYFSFLRPYSELFIANQFAKLPQYHNVFTSCNKAFMIDSNRRAEYWCANCDKCRFVFLALAVFMSKAQLLEIFKVNLLDQADQEQGYRELLGLSGHKPFECVGEIDESRAALCELAKKAEWQNDLLVKKLITEIGEYDYRAWLTPSEQHLIPKRFL
ncbi:MAG: endonuclease domain-containing protein [Deltaproteobacteria bacterium]|jgi:hypothetical protein|nr:endonuclease domain-containing protein [Deltaproteobacteria bacterium]